MGIYWNKDEKAEPKARPERAAEPKPTPKPGPSVRGVRAWTSPVAGDDVAADPENAGETHSRKR